MACLVLCNPYGVESKTGHFIPPVSPTAIQVKAFQAFLVDGNEKKSGL
jgi:hypothetical protein